MKNLTNEEKVLKLLLKEFENSPTNRVTICRNDIQTLDIDERIISRSLHTLETDGKIIINEKDQNNIFNRYWEVTLTSEGIYHFDNKQEIRYSKRNNWIQFLIPTLISIIALITSITFKI